MTGTTSAKKKKRWQPFMGMRRDAGRGTVQPFHAPCKIEYSLSSLSCTPKMSNLVGLRARNKSEKSKAEKVHRCSAPTGLPKLSRVHLPNATIARNTSFESIDSEHIQCLGSADQPQGSPATIPLVLVLGYARHGASCGAGSG